MIAAAHKSSGKTVVSAGIAAALCARGETVPVFKKGPDYIDPMWLSLAAGQPAYNLDFNTMSKAEIRALFQKKAVGGDVSLIEANKGLFDGVAADGSDSNAALARLLVAPVVLVVDTKGMTRGIAPLLRGYLEFDHEVRIAGCILNKTGGSRHESKLRQAVETYTDLQVLGAVGTAQEMDIFERHLGLTTPADALKAQAFIREVGIRIAQSVDLDRLLAIARSAPDYTDADSAAAPQTTSQKLRIGIARDEAFTFYYPDDLEAFEVAGAELVPVDMIRDTALPDLDGLFIGGGFPEVHAAALAANASMRESVWNALNAGLPTYAECGGLMYLCRSLEWKGMTHSMVEFFDADIVMHDRPQGRGYVRFISQPSALWPSTQTELCAHEFHYASLDNLASPTFGRQILRGYGIDGKHDALVKCNTQAGFFHLRHSAQTPWVTDFLEFVSTTRARAAVKKRSS